jgi:hypothetical protein
MHFTVRKILTMHCDRGKGLVRPARMPIRGSLRVWHAARAPARASRMLADTPRQAVARNDVS